MKKTILCTLLFLSVNAFGFEQEYAITGQPLLRIKIRAEDKTANTLRVYVVDKESGQKTALDLENHSANRWFEGTYVIQFKHGTTQDRKNLQFVLDGSTQKLFVEPEVGTKMQSIVLFAKEHDVVEYLKALSAKNAKVLTQAQAPLKVEERQTVARENSHVQEQVSLSLEAQEALRREEMLKKQEAMSKAEKVKRQEQAAVAVKEARNFYDQGKYDEASQSYAKALELDPERDNIYYPYGVTLYKTGDYNKSLAMLSMAEGGEQDPTEQEYYVALNHMKLKEFDKAREEFHSVQEDENKDLSPMASFLAGNIEYQQQKYTEAKASFEYVVDHSHDPQLDNSAEKMIEQIDRLQSFLESTKEKFRYAFYTGVSYDGNVLNTAQQNLATDDAAYRLSYGASALYKLYQSVDSELATQASFSDMYSVDKNLKANATIQAADPQQISLGVPYRTQFEAGKTYTLNVTPSISSVAMSIDTSSRETILQSNVLDADISFQMGPEWLSTYRMQLDQDISFLSTTSEDDDQAAFRTTVGMTQVKLLGKEGTRSIVGDFSYAANAAKGKNNNYKKIALGLGYNFPAWYKSQGNVKLEFDSQDYPDLSAERKDTTATLSLSAAKSLQKNLSWLLLGQYVSNASNLDQYKYNKVVIMTAVTYTGSILSQ